MTFNKIIHKWYWVVFSVFIGFIGAWFYLRYATLTYKVQSTILLKDPKSSQDFLDALDLFGEKANVENISSCKCIDTIRASLIKQETYQP